MADNLSETSLGAMGDDDDDEDMDDADLEDVDDNDDADEAADKQEDEKQPIEMIAKKDVAEKNDGATGDLPINGNKKVEEIKMEEQQVAE